ncbi:pentatricopeptide repeat-containing protein At3g29230 [Phoenix dactylifera]|uniref:Pentatricopeptide repeat-containing protein At3g29230 n=1 Tax=Phoenix dactylifera TaxID=42345 RepID=A0A8B7BUW9_PHODC|nr:pentatricopeptide repeat-containing protein At3g29230 [Phoenix dactylifera]
MSVPIRPPGWVSHRRLFEQKLAELHHCSNLHHIKQIQAQIFKANLHRDPSVAPKLVSAYSLCRHLAPAVKAFRLVPDPNVLLYNTLIRAFAHNSQPSHAFCALFDMQKDGIFPDNFTYPFLLKACCGPSGQSALARIEMIHSHVIKLGFLYDIFVPNSLIDSYSRAGTGGLASARKIFDEMPHRDIVSWNSMIAGLMRAGELKEARRLFDEMPERDTVSWNTLLDGHAKAGEMDKAFELFERMPERNVVSWSTVVSGYCKMGDMDMARLLFDKMPVKNLVPWTIMISGYAEKGLAKEAMSLLDQMEDAGLEPDAAAIVSILAASAESGLLSLGRRIHAYVRSSKLRSATQVCNALVDMYSKCGCLDMACRIFDGMAEKDLVSWNSLVQGLAMHGHGEKALDLFARMKREGIRPDGVTFIGVLCACTHVGLIEEGQYYFSSMERDYGIVPQIEHYGCMIDLLGRGGLLNEAFDLTKSMPLEPNAIIWGTLLGACRVHNNVSLAEKVVEKLVRMEPSDAGNYAILSNIYAAAGRWDGMAKARIQMKGTGAQKPAGSSWIELNDMVHEFTVGDRTHPHSKRIFQMLDRLGQHLKQVGYVPRAYL